MTNGSAVLVNVTVAGNQAVGGGPYPGVQPPNGTAQGGGLFTTNATVLILNSIVSGSTNGGNVWGSVTDGGYNLCSDNSAAFSAMGSLNGVDPRLGPLADNGGPTETLALLPGSPAIDAVPSGFPPTDQRGVTRPQGLEADMGAFEVQAVSSGATPPHLTSGLSGPNLTVTFDAQPGQSYRLLSSSNLTLWTAVATNSTPIAGPIQFVSPVAATGLSFYRVVAP
jgi:hypothetical protein